MEASPELHVTHRLPLHQHCLFSRGIPLGELWYFTELALHLRQAKRSHFMLTAPPLRLTGAVGSPVTPVATSDGRGEVTQNFRQRRCDCRADHRRRRQDHRARPAARARQGEPYRQRAVQARRRRSLDQADDLHRADAGEAAAVQRAREAVHQSGDRAAVRRLSVSWPTPTHCMRTRCRRISRSTSSSSSPAAGSARRQRSRPISRRTTPTPSTISCRAASMSSPNWLRSAWSTARRATASAATPTSPSIS